jgi:hypothetical protein
LPLRPKQVQGGRENIRILQNDSGYIRGMFLLHLIAVGVRMRSYVGDCSVE